MQNLWPEFDKEQSQAESAQRVQKQPSYRSRPAERELLFALREWLLHDYIVPYCKSLAATRIFRRCYWIDGLGGNGVLQSVLSTAKELANEDKQIALHYLSLESKRNKQKERKPGEAIEIPKESASIWASWPEAATSVLQVIDRSAAIFSLNPLTSSSFFAFEDLSPLYQRTAPTELCLLISYQQIENRLIPVLGSPDGAAAFTSLLRSDRWKSALSDHTEKNIAEKLSIAFFDSIQQQHFLTAQFIHFLMPTSPTVVKQVPYALIYATRRQDSLLCMNDALCVYHRRLQEQSLEGTLTQSWFVAQQQERLTSELRELYQRILRQGRTKRQRRWPDLRQQMLIQNFGQFTLQDYDTIIQKLLSNGEVRCEWRQRPPDNSPSDIQLIPGNEDMLLW
jgi:hypothetical protein